jgi:hypothetical protein
MQRKRRSGRIAKEIAIVLLGTNTTGKVFSENTKTVVLSRHGAGIISRYRFSPDERLTLRLPDSTQEAEIRLVGQIGGEPGRFIYGVAFVDPNLNFWAMEFPPPESFELDGSFIVLECSRCQAQENVEQHEIEEDVYSVNDYILRQCAECGTSTPWKKSEGKVLSVAPPPSASKPALHAAAPSFAMSFEPALAESRPPASAEPVSSYSGTSTFSEFAALSDLRLADIPASSAVASATAVQTARPAVKHQDVLARELDASGRPVNKRRHVRIRVSFSACVRHSAHADEVVECENVSKGGVCFHSRRQYKPDSLIEVAAPFSPGETALFVPARIRRVETLSGQVFRYGVEYIKSSVPTQSF